MTPYVALAFFVAAHCNTLKVFYANTFANDVTDSTISLISLASNLSGK